MSVLKLSTMWCLDELRTRAIEGADAQVKAMPDVVERILLARRHNVSRWLIDGYEILGKRQRYLSPDEQTKLGLETAVRVSELRERSWAWYASRLQNVQSGNSSGGYGIQMTAARVPSYRVPSSSASRDQFDYVSSIRVIFLSELALDKDYLAEQYAAFDVPQE